jgi:hypothetical protein
VGWVARRCLWMVILETCLRCACWCSAAETTLTRAARDITGRWPVETFGDGDQR